MEEYLNFAGRLADAARETAMPYFRGAVAVQNKGDDSPVTVADRECEKKMRALIAETYPRHSVYGEEFGGEIGGGFVWVLDPIDGTRSFISGSRQFCALVALVCDGAPVVGVIDMPALGERWAGCDSPRCRRAIFNGAPCAVSGRTELSSAVMATTTLGVAEDSRDLALRRLCRRAGHVRLGGDASAFGALASGFLDAAADYEMACYDYLPLTPIVRAAGGVITDWRGAAPAFVAGTTGIVAAASGALHEAALSALAGE
ncbi:MAG: inositol monophosphatase family protein [Gammaproteobacteria bacterium]